MSSHLRLREGWSSLALLLLLLLTMAWSFVAGGLAEELSVLPWVVLIGALLGFIFAKTRMPGIWPHLLGLIVGSVCGFLLVSSLIALPRAPELLGVRTTAWWAILLAKGQSLAQRLRDWVAIVRSGRTGTDPLPFVIQMMALNWLIAFYAAWSLFRMHWIWGTVLPAGVVTFLSVYYAPPRLLPFLVLYLLAALLLIVRSNVYQHEENWQREHVVYDQDIGLDFLRAGATAAFVLIVVVWAVPRPALAARLGSYWTQLQGPWQRVIDEWRRLYSSLVYSELTDAPTPARAVNLTGALNLSNAWKMDVQSNQGHYWRSLVLDRYTGTGWVDTSQTILRFSPGVPLTEQWFFDARMTLTQTVTLAQPGQPVVYLAGEPLRVYLPIQAQVSTSPSRGTPEVSAVYASALRYQKRYVVSSLVTTVDVRSLRSAGTDYPDWVTERYLQVPETLPPRIASLAREVAGAEPTPYDQAVAIQSYLRKLHYNQDIDNPPPGRDPVEWFLFENREGYCTYYASAMVLMCRTLNVPARLAQGYASGEHLKDTDIYRVLESDAHAWPEVFFPRYGWIEFEPTPSQPVLVRPSGEGQGAAIDVPPSEPEEPEDWVRPPRERPEPDLGDLGDDVPSSQRPRDRRSLYLTLGVGGTLVLAAGAAFIRSRRWHALRPGERLYLRLTWVAARIGAGPFPQQTPFEFGRSLSDALGDGADLVERIVRLYVRERFGQGAASEEEIGQAEDAWREFVPLAVRSSLKRLVPFAGQR